MRIRIRLCLTPLLLGWHFASAQTNAPIPWDQVGARAGVDYKGGGLVVSATASGARLQCVFQRLDGEATCEGLWLTSTVPDQPHDRFRVKAGAVGRSLLPKVGDVSIDGQTARFARPGLVEEYSVSMDGVRQDFVVLERPAANRALRLELSVTGATVEQTAGGTQLVPNPGARSPTAGCAQPMQQAKSCQPGWKRPMRQGLKSES